MSVEIHPTAIVSDKAKIGNNVKIGANSIIKDDVEIGDNVEIRNGVIISDGSRIASGCKFYSYSIISTEPQDLKYADEPTLTHIGRDTVVREFATINRGTAETGKTTVGSNCLIMTYCHVAHDCTLGDNIIMSNATQLAGHVTVEDWVIFGGVAKIHQFCKIGMHSFIGADLKIVKDVAPFVLMGKVNPQVEGINKVGLRRRGFDIEQIKQIEEFYDTVLFSGLNTSDGVREYKKRNNISKEVLHCINFIDESKRGIYR